MPSPAFPILVVGDERNASPRVGRESDEDDSADDPTTTDPPEPTCTEPQALCGGECTEIQKDKRACGVECVDCTALYDNKARCIDGVCEPRED